MMGYFFDLADRLQELLAGEECYLCTLRGEASDFVRFNHGRVRQAGRVTQGTFGLNLIQGRRHAGGSLQLAGTLGHDLPALRALLAELREVCACVPEDPYLLYATEVRSSTTAQPGRLPPAEHMVERILQAGARHDLVGILASGEQFSGFANSLGQRNWHSSHSFNFDWSLYLQGSLAVKTRYAGLDWSDAAFAAHLDQAAQHLVNLQRPARTVEPGRYRAYLAPLALEEITDLLSWGGFGLRAHRTGTTPLLRMVQEEARLHPALTLIEHTAAGVAPDFQEAGFIRPPQVTLIEGGAYRDCLVSPRSAAEYGVTGNGAGGAEMPLALAMAPGELPAAQALEALDTGLFVGNLWYLNYSDRNAARLTGMTRFATFWVEHGRIQAPVNALRFDDTLYNLLGRRLLAITRERELLLDPGSYGARAQRSSHLPGILVDEMRFTL